MSYVDYYHRFEKLHPAQCLLQHLYQYKNPNPQVSELHEQ